MSRLRTCLNPGCEDWLLLGRYTRLCKSCRDAALTGFAVGGFLAGVLVKLWPYLSLLKGWFR